MLKAVVAHISANRHLYPQELGISEEIKRKPSGEALSEPSEDFYTYRLSNKIVYVNYLTISSNKYKPLNTFLALKSGYQIILNTSVL